MKIYTYYDHGKSNKPVVSVTARDILQADTIIKSQGFNPLKLSCSIGIRYVLVDIDKSKLCILQRSFVSHSTFRTSPDVFTSKTYNNFDELRDGLKLHMKTCSLKFTEVFVEKPSCAVSVPARTYFSKYNL